MTLIAQFFETNQIIISFLYPLVFFLMGFGILLKNRVHSQFHLAKSLQFMAFFGLTHSFADWGDIFIPMQASYLSPDQIDILKSLQLILKSLSFAFLLYFGIDLLRRSRNLNRKYLLIAPAIFCLWLFSYLFFPHISLITIHRFDTSNLWSKLFITLPSGIVSGYAIYSQHPQFQKFNGKSIKLSLLVVALLINLYTISDGFDFSDTPFSKEIWLTDRFIRWINENSVDYLRGIIGALISFFILKTLHVVDIEYRRYFAQAEKQKVVMEERNRIARDIHDGMIQSIYAIGLHLEGVSHMIDHNETFTIDQSVNGIQESIHKLNDLIQEIRGYIKELKMPISQKKNLKDELTLFIQNVNNSQSIPIAFQYDYSDQEPPLSVVVQIFYIVKEAVSNLLRHSKASRASISVYEKDAYLIVEIADNGIGMQDISQPIETNPDSFRQGIRNMTFRASKIGGVLSIRSGYDQGTVVTLKIKNDMWKEGSFEDEEDNQSYAR